MESYGHFEFNLNREDGFYSRYALDDAKLFMFLDKYSNQLSFMNNSSLFYDIFSKTLVERINNRYKIEEYSYSIFDYFTEENIKNNDFVYYHFEMPHGPFRFKDEFPNSCLGFKATFKNGIKLAIDNASEAELIIIKKTRKINR